MIPDRDTRRWQLVVYARGKDAPKQPIHESVCIGDDALDDALKPHEKAGHRILVHHLG